jgi:hypothetical protein
VRLANFGFDASAFVVAGDQFADRERAPVDLTIFDNSAGYDGQFFYRLALNPFTSKQTDFGIRLDMPGWRQQRLLYPVIVHFLSFGNSAFVPALLIAVNLVGLGVIGWIGAQLAMQMGRHALWGLLFPLHPGFLMSLSRDLSEIVAVAFLLLGILLLKRRLIPAAAIVFCAAVLTRETVLLVPLAVAGVAVFGGDSSNGSSRRNRYWLMIPLCAYAGMQILLWMRWGLLPVMEGSGDLGAPLGGVLYFLRTNWPAQESQQLRSLAQFGFILGVGGLAGYALASTIAGKEIACAWAAYVGLMISLTAEIWIEDVAFLRAYTECYVLSALLIVGAVRFGTALRFTLAVALVLTWFAVAGVRVETI